jgi:hypothetical protein
MCNVTFRRARVTFVAVDLSGVQVASFLRRVILFFLACLSYQIFKLLNTLCTYNLLVPFTKNTGEMRFPSVVQQ